MWDNLFKHVDIDPSNAHILDGNAQDLEKECEEFERKIESSGGIELFLGGEKIVNYENNYIFLIFKSHILRNWT